MINNETRYFRYFFGARTKFKQKLVRFVFDRHMRWRLPELLPPGSPVILDYPVNPEPRYGYGRPPHPQLHAIINERSPSYQATLEAFLSDCGKGLADIAAAGADRPEQATFINDYFSGLDAIALYGFLAQHKPSVYFEVGSGFSTRFAQRAIHDYGLTTTIVCCDPRPRTEIARIADHIIADPLESIDPTNFARLAQGDILFIDGSHRCFTNSDANVLFLEILPVVNPGVIIHIHDILLPFDYPPEWSSRFYSEQYLLACYLLGGCQIETLLPNAFVSKMPSFEETLQRFWRLPGMASVEEHTKHLYFGYVGSSFWFRKGRAADNSSIRPVAVATEQDAINFD